MLFAAGTGAIVKRLALDRPATALAAADGVAVVGAAAGSDALLVVGAATAKLAAPAAVCALALRGGRYAAGCLDGAVRICGGGDVATWAGFQAPVRVVAFSGSGGPRGGAARALACVAPGLDRGEAPVLGVAPRRPRWAHATLAARPRPGLAAAAVDGPRLRLRRGARRRRRPARRGAVPPFGSRRRRRLRSFLVEGSWWRGAAARSGWPTTREFWFVFFAATAFGCRCLGSANCRLHRPIVVRGRGAPLAGAERLLKRRRM